VIRHRGDGSADAPAGGKGKGGLLARFFINRNYALFMAGAFVSAPGSWAQAVALSWLVLELGN